jgi:hypothetical protein
MYQNSLSNKMKEYKNDFQNECVNTEIASLDSRYINETEKDCTNLNLKQKEIYEENKSQSPILSNRGLML